MPLVSEFEVTRQTNWVVINAVDPAGEPWMFGLSFSTAADAIAGEKTLRSLLGRVWAMQVGKGEE